MSETAAANMKKEEPGIFEEVFSDVRARTVPQIDRRSRYRLDRSASRDQHKSPSRTDSPGDRLHSKLSSPSDRTIIARNADRHRNYFQ